ncbi:hypothetical protein SPICUR_00870 [Spiribacter curvatus]|uniref:Solute-binding protein family 3/N-terminal domain-containing protein n=2 Tax=Spiribacter curvatus TaxID=1335757 RepID=U5T113_9GAMM|nr:hypothetical protein SPICUR_00870 [Spiribacter curvatus]
MAVVVFCIAVVSAACEPAEEPELRIGLSPWIGYSYFSVANERGYTADSDALNLEIVEVASQRDAVRAFERGQVDLIGATLAELADIKAGGRRSARAVLALDRSVGGDVIIARKDIETLDALKGQRVGLEPGTVNMLVLAAAARQGGFGFDDVTMVSLPQSEMAAALEEGRIDAAITYPPITSGVLEQPGTHVVFDTSMAPNAVVDVLVAAEAVIENQPRALEALIEDHDRALRWSQASPEPARAIIAAHTGLSPRAVDQVHGYIEVLPVEEQLGLWATDGTLIDGLRRVMDIRAELYDQPEGTAVDVASMLDRTFVERLGSR